MKLTEVQVQPWHTLVATFYICESCSRVDTDIKRTIDGSICKHCGALSPRGAKSHFGLNSIVLVPCQVLIFG